MARSQEKDTLRGKKALIVFGVGMGYQLSAIRERKDPRARIYAIERYPEVYDRAVETQQWDVKDGDDVEFFIGEDINSVLDHLDRITEDMEEGDYELITNRPSIRLDPEYYKKLIRSRRPRKGQRRGPRS
jgi:hypothetical protein